MRSSEIAQGPRQEPSTFVVRLEGEFDLSEHERLTDAFSVAQKAEVVVVDLQRTTYVDSSVLQCLVALNMVIQQRGAKLILVGLRPPLTRLLEITELRDFFDIRESTSDVLGLRGAPVRRLTIESRPIWKA